jgi:hypothetical protein
MKKFETGATRNHDDNKLDFEGFLSPLVLQRFAQYMHKNRVQDDGTVRTSDNWQKGIPKESYMKSGWRHFFAWWFGHRNSFKEDTLQTEEDICGVIFNAQGYLHELLRDRLEERK